jgi:hypothetical protein
VSQVSGAWSGTTSPAHYRKNKGIERQ